MSTWCYYRLSLLHSSSSTSLCFIQYIISRHIDLNNRSWLVFDYESSLEHQVYALFSFMFHSLIAAKLTHRFLDSPRSNNQSRRSDTHHSFGTMCHWTINEQYKKVDLQTTPCFHFTFSCFLVCVHFTLYHFH